MKDGHEVIFTQKWWEMIRFQNFGRQLAEKLREQPLLKDDLRDLFKSQNDKLSYYDLFQFIEFNLQIKMKNWEEEAIENRLDRLGLAFIEFNEFNEFSMTYGIDWGESLIENDIEAILETKLNLCYKDYVLSQDDYFMECSTMLTSEKAALAKVSQIYRELKLKKIKKFIDIDFGPKDANDVRGNKMSIYKEGQPSEKGQTEPEDIEWVHPERLCSGKQKPQFVDDGAGSNDCI